MKYIKYLVFAVLILALLWPATTYAKEPFDDKVIFGGTFTLESGETLDGNLVVFGGAVTLEPDSVTNGDVVLIGGTVEIGGLVNGSCVGIGSTIRLGEQALVNGDLVTIGATLRRADGARVNGQVVNELDIPSNFTTPRAVEINGGHVPEIDVYVNPMLDVVWFFFRIFLWAAMSVLVLMFFATQTERITKAALSQPLITGAAGLISVILAPLTLIALTITLILIPVTFVAAILLFVAWLLGWVALGLEVGRRIAKMLDQEWPPPISAGIGTFILFFVLGGFNQLVPCVGWLPQTLVGMWGLGAVLLTRFGTQDYPAYDANTPLAAPVVVDVPEDGFFPEDETPESEA